MDEVSKITKVTLCPTGHHPLQGYCPKEREKMKKEGNEKERKRKITNKERKTEKRKKDRKTVFSSDI